jgi:hypothetical protein
MDWKPATGYRPAGGGGMDSPDELPKRYIWEKCEPVTTGR